MPYHTQKTRTRSVGSYNGRRGSTQKYRGRSYQKGPKKSYIHPTKFVQAAKPRDEVKYDAINTFADFEVADIIKNNLEKNNILHPSAIQDQAIMPALSGKDIVGVANTGTGKTVAFGVPLLNSLMLDRNSKALILAPTRELALQIEQEFKMIAKGTGLAGAVLIGGTSMGNQLRDLRHNPQIVVGTPGRVKDHIDRKSLNIGSFNKVVLDEVDRMLDMGFIGDIREILGQINPDRQSYFFSATLDKNVGTLINTFSSDPVTISVKTGETSENVEQDIVAYQTIEDKMIQLHELLSSEKVTKALVFDETQRSVERLSRTLEERGFKADAIHGGKSQGQRQRALDKFKKSHINILVATDVAARGIDVSDISHVINYSEPQAYEDYIHRIGRAGRAGRTGYAFTFVKA